MATSTAHLDTWINLGKNLQNYIHTTEWQALQQEAYLHNKWFTHANTQRAIAHIIAQLSPENLSQWLDAYNLMPPSTPKKVGVLAAGNIPFVAWQDILCVLLSGHQLYLKLSNDDSILLPFLLKTLCEISPKYANKIHLVERLTNIEAVIATGSDNAAQHFRYYFAHIPAIIRQNRNSCAVLSGTESSTELQALSYDIFQYFGLGCRSITKLYVPQNYDFIFLLDNFQAWQTEMGQHHKYNNNYDYHKALFLLNQTPHLDTGFLLVTPSTAFSSPIGVLHYEYYTDIHTLTRSLSEQQDKLQCIASNLPLHPLKTTPLGTTQQPKLGDYADAIDILQFLQNLI